MNAVAAAPGVTALVIILIMAVGPDLVELIDVLIELYRKRGGKHRVRGSRLEVHVTHWLPTHPKMRESAPQICDASEATRVALDGMMVWPYREDPLTETTQGMRAVS